MRFNVGKRRLRQSEGAPSEELISSPEAVAVDCIKQLFDSYSLFQALVMQSQDLSPDALEQQRLKAEQCRIANQTLAAFRRLESVDPWLVASVMRFLSGYQQDCVLRFYAVGKYRDRRQSELEAPEGTGMQAPGWKDRKAFRDGLFRLKSNLGLLLQWLHLGASYDDIKRAWPMPPHLSLAESA